MKRTGIEIDTQDLLQQFREFDGAGTGVIKVYLLINVLKHNYPAIFSDECLLGLQFQLECLSGDGTVHFEDFVKYFLEDTNRSKSAQESRPDRKSPYNSQDYADLLSKIKKHVKDQGLELMRIFDIFSKQPGYVTFDDLSKILELIEFNHTQHEFELIKKHAVESNLDESQQGTVDAYKFMD
jgi:Ca2+-binding EF-hand superfamily protein